jgi:hypothetical protein
MDIQLVIVGMIILGAVAYAATVFLRKGRAAVAQSACADDCGCSSSKSKTPTIAH